ncbi:hypothetical protein [Neobacillus mesonae]|uniref:hypothetical protein n=1 Tax=Neobacillus mesonae TaxID=1193713 RepID=UPI00203C07A8|nr:hypothetical protein [Neobacillus mesonae]MCM3568582.1 hypothetical protein [Neobacillus mesonae]
MIINSILILLIVIGIVFGLTVKLGKSAIRRGNTAYSKKVSRFFAGYFAFLIICMIVSFFLPDKSMTELKKVNVDVMEKESMDLYHAAQAGNIEEFNDNFLYKKWEFDFQGNQLKMKKNSDTFFDVNVMVERKEKNDGHIEAGFYMTRSEVNNLDISKLAHPPQLEIADGQLLITNSPKNKIRLAQFTNTFPVRQFNGEKLFGHESHSGEGQTILYMKIPKNLQFDDTSNLNLEYVGGI